MRGGDTAAQGSRRCQVAARVVTAETTVGRALVIPQSFYRYFTVISPLFRFFSVNSLNFRRFSVFSQFSQLFQRFSQNFH